MRTAARPSIKAIDKLADEKGYTLERRDSGVFMLFTKRGERLAATNPAIGLPTFYSLKELQTFLESC